MDLRTHYPYWLMRHGIMNSFPSLSYDHSTEVLVMGAGISGVLVAKYLWENGHEVTIVDRRHAGMGSTAASTALLQYETDLPLHKLITRVGEKNAVRSYLLCRDAIHEMGGMCHSLDGKALFRSRPSFQFASYKKDQAGIVKEFHARKKAGL